MAAVQKYGGLAGVDGGFGVVGGAGRGRVVPDQFPVGMRVLVVDDDTTCLRILDKMLRKCLYQVTTSCRATDALSLLRERKGCFDVVISDVHMPDMDGYKLLELVGLEMDLPVIMMSADGRTSAVMKGIVHGACDYLIKPVRMEELQNIWQHVVRKKWNGNKENDNSGSADDSDRHNKRANDEAEYCSTVSEGTDGRKFLKKRKDSKEDEDEGELENDDPSSSKKPRVVWSVELHQQFVTAVNQLGIDKAVPKRILELMNVPGLTRENVASHLQKFRLYLKRISVAQHQGGMSNSFCGAVESNQKLSPVGRLDFQALAASGQIPPQTLAALQSEFLGRPKSSLVLPGTDSNVLLPSSLQGSKCLPAECGPLAFGQPLMKYQTVNNYSQPLGNLSSGFTSWPPSHLGTAGASGNLGGLVSTDSKMLVQMLHQQQQQQSVHPEPCQTITVQPSCLVVPSQVPNGFQSGNNGGAISQACTYNGSTVMSYEVLSQSNNVPTGIKQVADQNLGVLTGYSIEGSPFSPTISSGSVSTEKQTGWQVLNSCMNINSGNRLPGLVPKVSEFSDFQDTKKEEFSDPRLGRNLGFVGKQSSIPSRYAVEDVESFSTDATNDKNYADGRLHCNLVKQEWNLDVVESAKGGLPGLHYSPSDLMSILSK